MLSLRFNETGKNLGVRRPYWPVLNDARYTGSVAGRYRRFYVRQVLRPGSAPSYLRPKPEDNPDQAPSPPNPLTLLVPQMALGDTTVGSTPKRVSI